MASEAPQDVSMSSTPAVPPAADQDQEPKYGGYSRFEIELEVSHHDSHRSTLPLSKALLTPETL